MGSCIGITCISGGYLGVIERCGRYNGDLSPGCHCIIPCIDNVTYKFDMKQQIVECKVDTKTKDNIFCVTKVVVYYSRMLDGQKLAYGINNLYGSISSTVQDVVRPMLIDISYDEALRQKIDIGKQILDQLNINLSNKSGIRFDNVNVTDIEPDKKVREAMNEIEIQNRLGLAAVHKSNALKMSRITEAEADAEAARLAGKGMADQRTEVMNGLIYSFDNMRKNIDIEPTKLMDVIVKTQELEALRHLADSKNTKCIFIPYTKSDNTSENTKKLIDTNDAMNYKILSD